MIGINTGSRRLLQKLHTENLSWLTRRAMIFLYFSEQKIPETNFGLIMLKRFKKESDLLNQKGFPAQSGWKKETGPEAYSLSRGGTKKIFFAAKQGKSLLFPVENQPEQANYLKSLFWVHM